ncbi:SusC/RagA family TonB-linked outer membrane protein [Sphingobacterium faecale]|uniref:SusC/RagA family TonB-linked outer membrane protein n=1 Tax=Sphingobacterium faecale TaxID=2803775 RepID=A0ABS1R8C6_9SPHI|nr:SusC/RagA family TonB-linked outer membrane protein [Sphingobacterium faecale]MBL1410972.1 SusC/RagA family TonB-linked outer membrane protein [Sphingobacterium faecale]
MRRYYQINMDLRWFLGSLILLANLLGNVSAQQNDVMINGVVRSAVDSSIVAGASIAVDGTARSVRSDQKGYFSIKIAQGKDRIRVTHMQFKSVEMHVKDMANTLNVYLIPSTSVIDEVEVVQTGYFSLPKERATGSYSYIDEKMLNRAVGEDILSRLDNLVPGLQFKNPEGSNASDIRVRGLSTIHSDETPLIVLDNFPYEGDLKNINPSDIESVTILKDAAAASIWGARAGNGVIVIQTKKGKFDAPIRLNLTHNTTWKDKPDLMKGMDWIPSSELLKIEKEKYKKSAYTFNNTTAVPAYVQLLEDLQQGKVTQQEFDLWEDRFGKANVRQDAMDYLYRPNLQQQYYLSGSGGGQQYRFNIGMGVDQNQMELVGNKSARYNLNSSGTFLIGKSVEWQTGLRYTNRQNRSDGIAFSSLTNVEGYQYLSLKDSNGDNMPVQIFGLPLGYVREAESSGLLDWYYRPLDERNLVDRTSRADDFLVQQVLTYQLKGIFRASANYQLSRSILGASTKYDKDSYYVRDLVNRFTQSDGTKVIPHQGIYIESPSNTGYVHAARLQLDLPNLRYRDHQMSGLAGSEIRISNQETLPGFTMYNYDSDLLTGTGLMDYSSLYRTLPTGTSRIPLLNPNHKLIKDRFLSYFGNLGYQFQDTYILTGSFRWDGSNLFGVKTNQKGTALWSVGTGWNILNTFSLPEDFLSQLKLRTTYGLSGNVNKSVSHHPIIRYDVSSRLNVPIAIVSNIGNPSLKWESVKTLNLGLDFGLKAGRLNGSVDYYTKNGYDLIGNTYLAPSTGVTTDYMINYADIKTKGVDFSLTSRLDYRGVGWRSNLLSSWVKNKVSKYNTPEVNDLSYFITGPVPPVLGESKDMLYALPWYGLDPDTGFPLMYLDGVKTESYTSYYYAQTRDDLVRAGAAIPTWYGSWRNDLSWRGLTLSLTMQFKFGYVFRKNSLDSGNEYNGKYHMDYFNRWQKSGDEKYTDVPRAIAYGEGKAMQSAAYTYTMALIRPGDHIRLNDIRLDYSVPLKGNRIKSLSVYGMARNLGLIWNKNKERLDPDYHNASYLPNKVFSFGFQSSF